MTVKTNSVSLLSAAIFGATVLGATALPTIASADNDSQSNKVVIYFTRHAEKQTTTEMRMDIPPLTDYSMDPAVEAGNRGENQDQVCGKSKCAEELSKLGLVRADLLADWFDRRGIIDDITHVYSSHKKRTRQTVAPTAKLAGLAEQGVDIDDAADEGVMQLPADGTELNPQSTGPSVTPTLAAIEALQYGDVAVIAGHSGTLYTIMEEMGIDTTDGADFPYEIDGKGKRKVRDFGDVWKVVIKNSEAKLKWRKNLQQPERLQSVETDASPDYNPEPVIVFEGILIDISQ